VERGKAAENDIALSMELHYILRVLWSGKWAVVTPQALLQALWDKGWLHSHQQQDAQEFLCYLLDHIQSELASISIQEIESEGKIQSVFSRYPSAQFATIIHQTFQGELLSQVTCTKCKNISNKFDPLFELCLDIPHAHVSSRKNKKDIPNCTIQDCLLFSIKSEEIDGFYCEVCKQKKKVKRQLSISQLPNVLCIVLKRFAWSGTVHGKIDTIVDFPLHHLDMGPYSSSQKSTLYDLQSIVYHHGTTLRVGHYTTASFNPEKKGWVHYNDSKVAMITQQELLEKQTPYLLFFQKANIHEEQNCQ